MRDLIKGIVDFHQNVQSEYRQKYGRLANGQAPDSLLIACSDSRVVPNTFASTNPGDLFVVRNVGNLIPSCNEEGCEHADESEAAAIEFSVCNLNVKDIIICGHSDCGAMHALLGDRKKVAPQNLRNWLRHGDASLELLHAGKSLNPDLSPCNQLSQLNVLVQMEQVKTYPDVAKKIEKGEIRIHGWWFDITSADVFMFAQDRNAFVLLDETEANRIIERMDREDHQTK